MDWTAIIVGVLGLAATLWQSKGKAEYAKAAQSVIKGVEVFSNERKDGSGNALKSAIKAVAATDGAQEFLHGLVKKVTKS